MVELIPSPDSVFKALADPTRRQLVERLSAGDCTVSELAEPIDMTLAGASKHIGVLEKARLVERRKHGRERICSLRPEALFTMRNWVERYAQYWDRRLDALDRALKEDDDE